MNEADLEMVEHLVKSPAFAALARVIEAEKNVLYQAIVMETDQDKIRQLQGRIQGMNLLVNIPTIITNQRTAKKAKAKKA